MTKLLLFLLSLALFPQLTHAAPDTTCSAGAFADALAQTAPQIDETAHESEIKQWIFKTFATPDVINRVLTCPEFASATDTESVKLMPIQYTFPGGREIVVNYETRPKILRQRLTLSSKRTLPSANDNNPHIGAPDDTSVWTNTDPAWYAIMVTEHGALRDFVGADKNNTISLQYIIDNIDTLYPSGFTCTSKSAIATDDDAINRAVTQTVGLPSGEDTNDYYVAGDVNLQWISYLEIALDVAITIATVGGGTVILGATKSARASRALKNLSSTIRGLSQIDSVRDYISATRNLTKLQDELKTIDAATDAARHADKMAEIERTRDTIRTLEQNADVKKYRDATKTYSELNAFRHNFRLLRAAQRGNIIARAARATKAAMNGNKMITRAAKLGRSSKFSTQVRDWLFQSTMRNIGMLAKVEAGAGLLYGAIQFVGGMYDWTEDSTGDFTNNIEFKPLLLLSADDLQGGQDNVVNYGMWLMWAGDTISPADDDAAYLQAMDFAAKFHQDLSEIQNESSSPCNVDIYVVRPVLRNPGTDNAALYYLIMNNTPWTTNDN